MKRFYKQAAVVPREGGFGVDLDGRPVRTPGKAILSVPGLALAERLAEEWNRQGERIDPLSMPVTQLVNTGLDRVPPRRGDIVAEIVKYAETDLICYRAERPSSLVARQTAAWDPLLNWLAKVHGARLAVTTGILAAAQDEQAFEAVQAAVEAHDDLGLAGLHVAVGAAGSVVIGLALSARAIAAEEAAEAALLEDLHQIEEWGEDEEALRRIETQRADILTAAEYLELRQTD